MTDHEEPTTEALLDALRSTKISDVPRGDPAYIAGWNDAMDHAARIADSLAASAALRESEARATATPGLDVALDDVMEGFRARHPNVSVFATATPGLREALERAFPLRDRGDGRLTRCRVIYGSKRIGYTCLDREADAANPESRYGDSYRASILARERRCDGCNAAAALSASGETEPDR